LDAGTAHNNQEEHALLERIAADDQAAFGQLVDKYTNIIYPYLLHWLKRAHEAEELTQDIFLRLWRNRAKLPDIDNFAGYVFVIARNRLNSALRERLLASETITEDKLSSLLADPSRSLEGKELAVILHQAIESLPPRRKEVFLLSRSEELTYEAIAERLGISRSAVRQHIVEALVFLRHYLKEHAGIFVSLVGWLFWLGISTVV
jgi:RNA polymerase sigma-70 factor (ECF subfamily)